MAGAAGPIILLRNTGGIVPPAAHTDMHLTFHQPGLITLLPSIADIVPLVRAIYTPITSGAPGLLLRPPNADATVLR